MTTRHYEVPPQLEDLLLEFTVNVLVNQPDNLVAYAVEYFTRLNESNKYSGSNKLAPADTNNVQDGAVSDQDDSMMSEDEGKGARGSCYCSMAYAFGLISQALGVMLLPFLCAMACMLVLMCTQCQAGDLRHSFRRTFFSWLS